MLRPFNLNTPTMKHMGLPFLGLLLFLACSPETPTSKESISDTEKHNILLIVADDLGYTDLGVFGSEIATPNIDALAEEGVLFTNLYTAPMCAPSRASILTGVNNHLAGVGCQFHRIDSLWGYEGYLSDRVKTIPEGLKYANYQSFMVGKWHLGSQQDKWPSKRGFDQSFVVLEGAANHYNDWGFTARKSRYAHNGSVSQWPEGAYSTEVFTDYALEFMEIIDQSSDSFFGYLAYTSPHWPLQVDEHYWKKYEAKYSEGYEALRAQRLQNLKDLNFIEADYELPELYPTVKPWNELDSMEQKIEIRKMALYAGMVENLDEHIGRIIHYLKESGEYDNTTILFLSDNGPEPKDFYNDVDSEWDYLRETYNNDYENMGSPSSFVSYGAGWAEAGSAPFRYNKWYVFEGGIRAPLIIKPAKSIPIGKKVNHSFVAITDLAETCYALAGMANPNAIDAELIASMPGTSILPTLKGEVDEIHSSDETWVLEHNHHVLVRRGEWKLVNLNFDWNEEAFVLYNLRTDPTESTNVRDEYPDIYRELLAEWKNFQKRYQVVQFEE